MQSDPDVLPLEIPNERNSEHISSRGAALTREIRKISNCLVTELQKPLTREIRPQKIN